MRLPHGLKNISWKYIIGFLLTDLTFFIKGGRISKISGWFGTALDICPLLNVSNEGKLIPRFKIRGKKKVQQRNSEEDGAICR